MRKLFLYLLIFSSCTSNKKSLLEEGGTKNWLTHRDTVEAGFIMTYKYPDSLSVADAIDNCRCVGKKIKNFDKNEGTDSTNTRQWCICMQDTTDYTVENLIKSWNGDLVNKITQRLDTVTIGNIKALRVLLIPKTKDALYRQLIYLKRKSTLFEFVNAFQETEKGFANFYSSITFQDR